MVRFMIAMAAAGLVVSLAVHLATYAGVDPMASVPGVWMLHLLIFPPFFAAIFYANKVTGDDRNGHDRVLKSAPRWLQWLTSLFFAYAFINFAIFMILMDGSPARDEGGYYLHDHGTRIRDISEAEYHHYQALEIRGFSGHWMLFYAMSLGMLVGAERLGSGRAAEEAAMDSFGQPVEPSEAKPEGPAPPPDHSVVEPASPRAGMAAAAGLILSLAGILSGIPWVQLLLAFGLIPLAVVQFRRMAYRSRRGDNSFESCTGCLLLIPMVCLVASLELVVCQTLYLLWYHDITDALTGALRIVTEENQMPHLSTGQPLEHYDTLQGLYIMVGFPMFILAIGGLICLAETVGRWIENRRSRLPGPPGSDTTDSR